MIMIARKELKHKYVNAIIRVCKLTDYDNQNDSYDDDENNPHLRIEMIERILISIVLVYYSSGIGDYH